MTNRVVVMPSRRWGWLARWRRWCAGGCVIGLLCRRCALTACCCVSPPVQDSGVHPPRRLDHGRLLRDGCVQPAGCHQIARHEPAGASALASVRACRAVRCLHRRAPACCLCGLQCDASGRGLLYSSTIDCLRKSVKAEGALSLWKGFWPNFGEPARAPATTPVPHPPLACHCPTRCCLLTSPPLLCSPSRPPLRRDVHGDRAASEHVQQGIHRALE